VKISNKQMQELARNPRAHLRFQLEGRLPEVVKPSSPLISLLEAIPPRLRLEIIGVKVDPSLGYIGGGLFHNAEQLLRWLKPSNEMLARRSWPAESRRDKRFSKKLTLEDLKPHCSKWPDDRFWMGVTIR